MEEKDVTLRTITSSTPSTDKLVDIDSISEKIAILQSQNYTAESAFRLIDEIKQAIQYGRVKPSEEKYWREVKEAAENLIAEWEDKNSELIA